MPSVNDNFADAIEVVIETNGGTYTSPALTNTGNTTETSEPVVGASGNLSMWFKYLPIGSGTATFDTMLSTPITSTDSFMAIWTGTNFGDMVNVGSDDDGGGSAGGAAGTSRIADLAVTGGTTYWVQCAGYGFHQMNMVLRVVGPATVSAGPDGNVDAVPATASALVIPPVVSNTGDATVIAVPATASALVTPPSEVSGEAVVEGGSPATATAQAHAPLVTGSSEGTVNANVNAVAATASAQVLSPVVVGTSANANVDAVPATASATTHAPIVSNGIITLYPWSAVGESRQDNAMRRLRSAGFSGSLQDMQRAFLLDQFGGSASHSVADLQIQFAGLDQVYDVLPDSVLPGV